MKKQTMQKTDEAGVLNNELGREYNKVFSAKKDLIVYFRITGQLEKYRETHHLQF